VVDFSISGKVVSEHLKGLFKRYGPPRVIRRDDGVEFKSLMARWDIEQEGYHLDSHLIMVIWRVFISFCALNA